MIDLLKDDAGLVWLINCEVNQPNILVGALVVLVGFNQSSVVVKSGDRSFLVQMPIECINQAFIKKAYNVSLACEELI